MSAEDFSSGAFFQRGGQVAALRAFGGELMPVVDELNEALGGNVGVNRQVAPTVMRIKNGDHATRRKDELELPSAGWVGVDNDW